MEAERRLRAKACRCIAKRCDRYFVGILKNVADETTIRRKRNRNQYHQSTKDRGELREAAQQRQIFESDPERWVAFGLDHLETQYLPDKQKLLYAGMGAGRGSLSAARDFMQDHMPTEAADRALVGWNLWQKETAACAQAQQQIRLVFDSVMQPLRLHQKPDVEQLVSSMMGGAPATNQTTKTTGAEMHGQLRNYPARSE